MQRAEGSPAAPKNETGDWRADLFTTPKGAVRNTFANITILRNAEVRRTPALQRDADRANPRRTRDAGGRAGLMREAIERR